MTGNSFQVNIYLDACLDRYLANSFLILSDGSVMIPQPCTEDLSADTEANEVQFSGVFFTCKPEKRCSGKIKFTDRSLPVPELSERPKLCPKELVIAPGSPFHPTGTFHFFTFCLMS